MKVIAKTNYACLAMFELAAQNDTPRPVRIREIAKRHGVPPRFLVQILLQLKKAGLAVSTRGAAGGYRLAKEPKDISLAEVMAAVTPPAKYDATTGHKLPSVAAGVLRDVYRELTAVEQETLSKISLVDLLKRYKTKNRRK